MISQFVVIIQRIKQQNLINSPRHYFLMNSETKDVIEILTLELAYIFCMYYVQDYFEL